MRWGQRRSEKVREIVRALCLICPSTDSHATRSCNRITPAHAPADEMWTELERSVLNGEIRRSRFHIAVEAIEIITAESQAADPFEIA